MQEDVPRSESKEQAERRPNRWRVSVPTPYSYLTVSPAARSHPASGSATSPTRSSARLCEERNPQSRRRLVPRALLQPRDICVNFVDNKGLGVQAMALDCRTMLGPQLRIQSAETLRRLLAYLGATPEQLADFDSSHRRWGQGTVQITLQPGRKNLLKIDYQRL